MISRVGESLGTATLNGERGARLEKFDGSSHAVRMQTTTAPMEPSVPFCPNLACSARGHRGQGNSRIHCHKRQRYRCRICGQTFSARRGTLFEGLRSPTELVVIVVTLLAFGCPVQAIVQAYGLDERTGASWRDRAGQQCQRVHQAIVEQAGLDLLHVQADEIRVKARSLVAWMDWP
jgi:transposase-like protein